MREEVVGRLREGVSVAELSRDLALTPARLRRILQDDERERIASLVALCEEYINELSLYNERFDVQRERARLAALKGAG